MHDFVYDSIYTWKLKNHKGLVSGTNGGHVLQVLHVSTLFFTHTLETCRSGLKRKSAKKMTFLADEEKVVEDL